jgi:hypothetical protein
LAEQTYRSRPDQEAISVPQFVQRLPQLTEEQIMVIAGIP